MMHTKIQGHRPFCSWEGDFFKFLPYMGMAAILVMYPGPFEQIFIPPSHRSSIWNLTVTGPVVSEQMFKECGQRRTMTEACLSYKLTKWAFGLDGLKKKKKDSPLSGTCCMHTAGHCPTMTQSSGMHRHCKLPSTTPSAPRQTCLCHMWTTKTQISLHIWAVWSESLLFAADMV